MLGLSEGTSYCLAVVSLCRNGAHKGLVEGIFAGQVQCRVMLVMPVLSMQSMCLHHPHDGRLQEAVAFQPFQREDASVTCPSVSIIKVVNSSPPNQFHS